ncbi:ABC transporter substrate-binding protein [Modestobacter sp. VKM Ac-2979]|uniref:ABC transporter substrate-binding protein n=1 Tax=unclassified Modestobacter TaxID=2643866 RepID=UPI0022ABA201|nr:MULTISPECIES: ABC transporter substrate-binding protein [unclassified Modestobacter]MCZ2814387.1 ABC transporter substrate-binding protein [Modestobacter sp. VKM Ac-2979]MCZ2843921.1 ABC transporter substrate-binding protein [Modestobacter sp. VKM Ac-2980]
MTHSTERRPAAQRTPRGAGRSVVVVALAAALAVLTGCGSENSGLAGVPTVAAEPGSGVEGVRAPSEEPGGTLRLVTGEIDSLDPQRSYMPSVWNLMRLYTRTLVTYSAEPGSTDELVPDLATDLGTGTDGGRTWTFTLREGVRFENGRPITSRDVKYGIQRSFASDVVVGGPTYVVDLLDDAADPYAGPYQDETADRLGLASIETPDDRTIVFRLTSPAPDFPFVMALPSSSPVPVESDTGGDYGARPVSSGPYLITSVDPVAGIVLSRNPEWDPATDDVRTALPDEVVVRTGLSGVARDQALLAGSADADLSGTGVQQATTSRLDDEDLAARIDDVTTGTVRLLALPTTVAPMDDPSCRAAVAAAVDRSAVQQALLGAGNAVRTSVLWPRAVAGAPEESDPQPDLAAARAALAACGQPDGFSTVLAVPDVPSSVEVAEAIAADLAEVQIVVEVRPLDPATYYATDVGNPDAVTAAGYGMVLATWTADFPTSASFLLPLVDGRSIRKVGNTNYAYLNDPTVNGLVDAARAATEPAAAADAWRQVGYAVQETSAYVPLVENRVQLLAGQRLRNGVVMQPYGGYDVATAGVR